MECIIPVVVDSIIPHSEWRTPLYLEFILDGKSEKYWTVYQKCHFRIFGRYFWIFVMALIIFV